MRIFLVFTRFFLRDLLANPHSAYHYAFGLHIMSEQKLTLDEAEPLLRGRMGLICGTGITVGGEFYKQLANHLAKKWGCGPNGTYLHIAQEAIDKGISADDIKAEICHFVKAQTKFTHLARFAKLKYSAVISFSLDIYFESELLRVSEQRTSGFLPTKVVEFPQVLPPKTIPVFKLLGSIEQNFVYSEISYTARRPKWRYAAQEFIDRVQAKPVLCLGIDTCQWLFLDFLSQMLSEPKTIPRPLLLVHSEFDEKTRRSIVDLAEEKTQIVFIESSITDIVSRIKDIAEPGPTLLPLDANRPGLDLERLVPFQDIVVSVNAQLKSKIGKGETAQLLDLLFSPTLSRWDPFYHNLDFRRTIGNQMLDVLRKPVRTSQNMPLFSLVGSAASGKTMVAKRLAYDLASKGYLVFWFRRTFYPNIQGLLSEFFRVLMEMQVKREQIYFFVDDPVGLGSVTMLSIASNAQVNGSKGTFVVFSRTSDCRTHDVQDITGNLDLIQEFQLKDQYDESEISALPNYLVSLQISPDKETARSAIANSASRLAADTLGILYWLLPKTRRTIEASVQEEYLRLGERAGLSRVIIGTYNKTSDFLRQAYAMVAVCDYYHTPLPVEILISALNISYRDWIDSVGKDGPAWGLLYGEISPDKQTIYYRPRNSIVTRILVETINGGTLAKSGEVEQLLKLLRSCTGTGSVYREFCVGILVPRTKISQLDYLDGLALYDAAITALPFEDRTLKHQKGLWVKDKGNNPLLAKEILEDALKTKVYPYSSRTEAEEHIHTSLAATVLDALDKGLIDLEQAIPEILQHVDRARSDAFFNPRAVHVQANLMLRLVSRLGNNESADTLNLLNQAFDAVDSALLVLRNPLKASRNRLTKDIEFLEDIIGKIYEKILPLDELKLTAEELWTQFKRQDGFVVTARKLYHLARSKNSGTAYNDAFNFCKKVIGDVQKESHTPSSDLCAVAVCIYYEWNINRYDKKAGNRKIEWALLYELANSVLQSAKYSGDVFYKFVSALALANLNKWPEAEFLFAQIRRAGIPTDQLFEIRALLFDDEGLRKLVQGTITGDTNKQYLIVEDMHKDFFLSRNERWPRPGEIAHCYIGFGFAGPQAIQSP
jgi:hypothetical protein